MSVTPLQALPLDRLRERSSTKWRKYPDDVLPLFVAEHDFPLAPAVGRRLARAVALGDTGYTPPEPGIRDAFAAFAGRRFGWDVDPARVRTTCDVMMGVVEILRRLIRPGESVVVTPPVYPPFYDCVTEAGGVIDRVPLLCDDGGWRLDVDGIEAAFAAGARVLLLCNPHNPTGTVHDAATLGAVAAAAQRYGARVVSDEIHAPMTMPGATFTPFLAASADAARVGYAVTSPSKAFNLAGLKCAIMIAACDESARLLQDLPDEVEWRTGLFGAIGGVAAMSAESDAWLDSLIAALDANRRLLADLLAQHVPAAGYRMPEAGYLAWVDLSEQGWGDNPAAKILREAKVALHYGPMFGVGGAGHVRVNIGCSPDVLREAVRRIGALV